MQRMNEWVSERVRWCYWTIQLLTGWLKVNKFDGWCVRKAELLWLSTSFLHRHSLVSTVSYSEHDISPYTVTHCIHLTAFIARDKLLTFRQVIDAETASSKPLTTRPLCYDSVHYLDLACSRRVAAESLWPASTILGCQEFTIRLCVPVIAKFFWTRQQTQETKRDLCWKRTLRGSYCRPLDLP